MLSVFWVPFYGRNDVKDDFLLKNEVLPCTNVNLVYKGKYPKIQMKIGHKFVGCLFKGMGKCRSPVKELI